MWNYKIISSGSVFGIIGVCGLASDMFQGTQFVLKNMDYINITWNHVFLVCASIGFVTLLYILSILLAFFWDSAVIFIKRLIELKPKPSMSYEDALHYIKYNTNFGKTTVISREYDVKVYLNTFIEKKKIIFYGMNKDNKSTDFERLDKLEIENLILQDSRRQLSGQPIVINTNKGQYSNIMFDELSLKREIK